MQNSERIIVPMSRELVEAIDDFRFANRISSRAEAIRMLLRGGIAAAQVGTADPPKQRKAAAA
jgi:metal-responsive CopG/Arc/MetJ family transcriptional regulator